MFDPTAFDNMKVVLEGALYDLDLDGEIAIIDRNDIVNMAKLSRSYDITFTKNMNSSIPCTILLEAGLANLAAELHPSALNEKIAGANLSITFTLQHENNKILHNRIAAEMTNIWGSNRSCKQQVCFNPLETINKVKNEVTITFNRLILEDQMDDLTSMIDYILSSIEKLSELSS